MSVQSGAACTLQCLLEPYVSVQGAKQGIQA